MGADLVCDLVYQILIKLGFEVFTRHREAISKIGFWFKFAAGSRFKPQEYFGISRI
jgi:hypothetical protein